MTRNTKIAFVFLFPLLATGWLLASPIQETRKELPETVSFNAHIRPIMSNTCFACHGPDEKVNTSGLRLDSFAAAVDEGEAITPGSSAESAVYQRLIDADDPMPPADFLHQLTDYEKALFKKWIDQGAQYQQHWSYTPVKKPAVPQVKHSDQVANPIDAFILRRLETEGIEPTELADKATLLRRLYLDLIGLPPNPAELQLFMSDDSPDAYTHVVDRLLDSPKYGERMASRWLDIVRFSDTVGFHGDQNQRIFPYRDYVIDSINRNQTFDEFTREQLAGDLLENPTDEQLVATGLIRLNMMTREGGAQPAEYLAKYTADRVRMVGTAWLGATTGCCECHNHKYDPFTIKDFYSLGAYFDDVKQWGVYTHYGYTPNPDLKGFNNNFPFPPEIRVPSESLNSQIKFLERELDKHLTSLGPRPNLGHAEYKEWFEKIHATWKASNDLWIQPTAATLPEGITALDDGSLFVTKEGPIEIPLQVTQPTIVRSIRMEVLPSEEHNGFVGRSEDGRFSVSLAATYQPRYHRPANDPIQMTDVKPRFVRIELKGKAVLSLAEVHVFAGDKNIAADGTATQASVAYDGPAPLAIDGNTSGNYADKSTTHTQLDGTDPWWELDLGEQTKIDRVVIWNRTDGNNAPRLKDCRVVLLDENRQTIYSTKPTLPSPSVDLAIPKQTSEFDFLDPLKIEFVQADRYSTNRFSSGNPSPFIQGSWTSGPTRWQLPSDEARQKHTAVFHLDQAIELLPEDRLLINLGPSSVGRVRFAVSPVSRPVVGRDAVNPFLHSAIPGLKRIVGSNRSVGISEEQSDALAAAYYQYRTPFSKYSNEAKRLRRAIAECRSGLAMSMVAQSIEEKDIPTARVLPRGDWQNESGEKVTANTPHFLAGYQGEPSKRLTRLDLANWLTSPANPLTARHYVNRTWKHFFGSGLSNVLDDLGNQGEWPSHPELLDWLAADFQSTWDRKHITRLIVTSNTYKQKAAVRKDLIEIDPYNRLLAQQSARRLEAEIIRDNALAISGLLLDDWIGGPSVFPYQPAGYYANLQFPDRKYVTDTDGRQYRRGLYMHWQRTFLHPMLANFDAPSRDECAADRTPSNSPQQALTLLNDPVFVEASRAFASRLMSIGNSSAIEQQIKQRIEWGFELALCRTPSIEETNALVGLYKQQLEYFQENEPEANDYQRTGQFVAKDIDPAEHAALAQVCRVILNLHETITRY